jgi:hypothetical protein
MSQLTPQTQGRDNYRTVYSQVSLHVKQLLLMTFVYLLK